MLLLLLLLIFFFSFFILIFRSMGILTMSELLVYLNDPWWTILRRCLFMSFWIILIAIFASACIISIYETKQHCFSNKSTFIPINNSIDIVSNYTISAKDSNSNNTLFQTDVNAFSNKFI